ncbi:hypothetical protein ACJBU6_03101 [Exserohilum turcicum]
MAKWIGQHCSTASHLNSVAEASNVDDVVTAVKQWLEHPQNTRWLMVLDNYDNPKLPNTTNPGTVDIRQFLPNADHGLILVTTRSSQVVIGHRIQVRKLQDMSESLQILCDASRRKDALNDPDALAVAQELDGLPLALATAGAYLEQVTTSFRDYLRLYKASWLKLHQTTPELSFYEDRQLYTTWQLSYDHIKQQNELSAKLLHLWAYFDNQDLWFELLKEEQSAGPEWFRQLTQDELSFNQAMRVLCNHGLAEAYGLSDTDDIESPGYKKLDKAEEILGWASRSCQTVVGEYDIGTFQIMNSMGDLFTQQGKLNEAEKMYERALHGFETTLGPDEIVTLNTCSRLGTLYSHQNKLNKAEEMYQRALQGYEKGPEPGHKTSITTTNELGIVYYNQGRLAEAEDTFLRALYSFEDAVGPNHPFTLGVVNNLGMLYSRQERFSLAEQMYTRALHGNEQTLGIDHTSILDTVNNLGALPHVYIKYSA